MKRHRATNKTRRKLLCSALVLALSAGAAATNVNAQDATEAKHFQVPAQAAASALNRFAEQADITLVFSQDAVAGVVVRPLQGIFTTQEALVAMLEDTGLMWQVMDGGTISVTRGIGGVSRSGDGTQDLQKVTVTGTRIRGGTTPSPIISIGAERIREEGFTDLGQVMRSVSQNYSGGQNPGVAAGAQAGGYYNQNVTGGATVNLRGIGQDATLTLLNGRRMSYGGYDQAVDISAIPIEAVDRIEIVTDGASAIYGSDAVGGVVNVVLKPDFDGVAVGARYGEATDGGLATREYSVTAGSTWPGGGLIFTLKKSNNDAIYADQRDYTRDLHGSASLYQEADLHSGLLSIHQSLGESIEVHVDALRTKRDKVTTNGYAASYMRIPGDTTTTMLSPGLVLSLPGDWSLNVNAAFGKDKTNFLGSMIEDATGATAFTSKYSYGNKSRMYELGAEGPLLTLPGGDARVAVGAGYRHNEFLYLFNDGPSADGEEGSRYAYAELNVPLVGPSQDIAGIQRLALTGALRTEDYDSYGRVTTPKIGLIYSPAADWTLKASWGKSFKTPTLYQGYIGQFSYLYPAATFGGAEYGPDATTLYLNGGNLDLTPERARTWSASIAFHPEALPGLEAELTGFHIDYTDRIIQPITGSSDVLITSMYEDFIRYFPTADEQADVIARTKFTNYTDAPYDSGSLVAIIDNRFVNASTQRIRGLDLSGSYGFDIAASRLTLRGSISWLDSERSLTANSRPFDVAGTLFYPAKVNSRIGMVWNRSGFTAAAFGNYRSGVTNTLDGTKGASFTTFDTTLRYDTGFGDTLFADMSFELSAQNILNRAPPLYGFTDPTNTPYDSANYSAIGRYLSVSVSKRW